MPPVWLFFPTVIASVNILPLLDVAYLGQPFVYVPGEATIDLETMDFAYLGQPFVVSCEVP